MNDPAFVSDLIEMLSHEGVAVWLFGGWAEELCGLAPPRAHHDVDLLFPADDFDRIDDLIRRRALTEVHEKHLPHKRAFLVDGVLVELVLVQRDRAGYYTDFFGRRWDWPADLLDEASAPWPTASRASLVRFRAGWNERPHLLDPRRA